MNELLKLREEFISKKIQPTDWLGDSPERFDTYTEYASKVSHITELGVYTGLTTTAFLLGKPKILRSYDITDKFFHLQSMLKKIASENNIDYKFHLGNSCSIDIESTEMLFIDTNHKEKITTQELNLHHSKVSKYIMLHDTTAWPGVMLAVAKFLPMHKEWHICYHDNNGCGLTVLKKN